MTIPDVYLYAPSSEHDWSPRRGYTAIYGLFDPRYHLLHYVGQSTDVGKRLKAHVRDASRGVSRECTQWIRRVLEAGGEPSLQIIEWVRHNEADRAEGDHIAAARACGLPLTNIRDSGEALQPCSSGKRKITLTEEELRLLAERVEWGGFPGGTVDDQQRRKGTKAEQQNEFTRILWPYMIKTHGAAVKTVPWETFWQEDLRDILNKDHPDLLPLYHEWDQSNDSKGWNRYHVCKKIRRLQKDV